MVRFITLVKHSVEPHCSSKCKLKAFSHVFKSVERGDSEVASFVLEEENRGGKSEEGALNEKSKS